MKADLIFIKFTLESHYDLWLYYGLNVKYNQNVVFKYLSSLSAAS